MKCSNVQHTQSSLGKIESGILLFNPSGESNSDLHQAATFWR